MSSERKFKEGDMVKRRAIEVSGMGAFVGIIPHLAQKLAMLSKAFWKTEVSRFTLKML